MPSDTSTETSPPRGADIRAFRSLLHTNTLSGIHLLSLNPLAPPFDNRMARLAQNYAVDRTKLLRRPGPLFGTPTCQMLPPNFPGYHPHTTCPYTMPGTWTPNLAKANRLVRESGTLHARVPLILKPRDRVVNTVTRYIQAVLRSLGYRAPLIPVKHAANARILPFGNVADSPAASYFLGLTGWGATYPARWVPNPWLDHIRRRALAAQQLNPAKATQLWAALDLRISKAGSTWVPLFNDISAGLTSPRVGNYQYNPTAAGPLIGQMWVK